MYTFKISRTYETIVEIESDTYENALKKLSETDIYLKELEQCCVIEERITSTLDIKYARQCSVTNEGMNEGWCFGDGEEYAKYESDAIKMAKEWGYDSIEEAFNDDACYWTEWEDDYQYEVINGVLTEID